MFALRSQVSRRCNHAGLRLLLALLSLTVFTNSAAAQQNVTLDDTDLYIMYTPATSWHASTVECDSCLAPLSAVAYGGTWHDGTHVVPTTDEDDEGVVGDSDGDSVTSSSTSVSASSSSAASPSPPSSTVQPAGTNVADVDVDDGDGDDNDNDNEGGKGNSNGKGKGGDSDGKGRSKRFIQLSRGKRSPGGILKSKRDENPFEVQGDDSDDPGFVDVPVTLTLNFTGEAVYVFAILPLFPAASNTTPTFTNLSFVLDGASHGSFIYRPDATVAGTPTINSSDSDKYQPNINVFSAPDLEDSEHSLIVNVGVDSVFLFDYVVYTVGKSDPTLPGSIATTAPDNQRTASAVANSSTSKHNVATFAGAVGGSFGLLSILALGLCISIRIRRRRSALRERRDHTTFAQNFTARDHGELEPDGDEEGGFGRNGQSVMVEAAQMPFVPRYFPGTLPSSPPPYVAEETTALVSSPLVMSMNREGMPIAIPSTLPPSIALPTATFDLQRTISNNSSHSYADRPPPTPPDDDTQFSLFVPGNFREERNLNGGIIGPLPIDTPVAEESDPMLSVEQIDGEEEREWSPTRLNRQTRPESVGALTFGAPGSSRNSASSEPPGTDALSACIPYSLDTSSTSSTSASSVMMAKNDTTINSCTSTTLSTSTSLPSLSAPSSSRFLASQSSPDLAPKPAIPSGLSMIAYPPLQPSRVPLPPSIYGSDLGSQETLERYDGRT